MDYKTGEYTQETDGEEWCRVSISTLIEDPDNESTYPVFLRANKKMM